MQIIYTLHDTTNSLNNLKLNDSEIASQALYNPYISMVINRIASVAANTNLLNSNPLFNESVRYRIYCNLLAFGQAWVIPYKPVGINNISKLEVLENNSVSVQYDESNLFKKITEIKYLTQTFKPNEFIHIRYDDFNSIYPIGLSPLASLKNIYKTSNYISQFEENIYKNRGVMGLLSGEGDMPITPNEKNELQEQFDRETIGVENAGKIKLITGGVTYTPLSFKPSDMLSTESQLEKLRTICAIYNVDSSLFNDKAASTYNNVKEAAKAFYANAVIPIIEKVNEAMKILYTDLQIDFDSIDALQQDSETLEKAKKTKAERIKLEIENIQKLLELELINNNDAKNLINTLLE